MLITFAEALQQMGPNAVVRVANTARPTGAYLFNTFLPERQMPDYTVDAANMVIRTTMAGLVAMDSPYPPGGTLEVQRFLENTAKLGINNTLTEQTLRTIQGIMREMQLTGTLTVDFLQREALNFLQKVIVQAQLDAAEWLRSRALQYGEINWTFNNKTLEVNYGIPAANFLTERTEANDDAYGDTDSAFWTDVATARRLLRHNVRAAVLNSVTMDEILNNPANNLQILAQDNNRFTVRRYVNIAGNTIPDEDARYTMDFVVYDEEAEVLDTANPGQTHIVKFMDDGKVLFVGQNRDAGYRPGQGSTDDPRTDMEIGYHHIAPTVEGNGQPGRWARLYTPEGYPMQLRGQGASNELPVITAPDKIVVATTEILGV